MKIKKKFTVTSILQAKPCYDYKVNNGAKVRELFGAKKTASSFDIINCELITEQDRIWILLRINCLSDRNIRLFACDAAENVLLIFQKRYPKDHRPAAAIQAGRDYIDKKITLNELQSKRAVYAARKVCRRWQLERIRYYLIEQEKGSNNGRQS